MNNTHVNPLAVDFNANGSPGSGAWYGYRIYDTCDCRRRIFSEQERYAVFSQRFPAFPN